MNAFTKQFNYLIHYEYKKVLCRKMVWITFAACVALCIFMACSHVIGSSYAEGKIYRTHYDEMVINRKNARALSGRLIDNALLSEAGAAYQKALTDNQLVFTSEKFQTNALPYFPLDTVIGTLTRTGGILYYASQGDTTLTQMTETDFYRLWDLTLNENWQSTFLSDGEIAHLQSLKSTLPSKLTYRYSGGWEQLGEMIYSWGIIITLFICVSVPGIFTEEHSRKTDQLILCTEIGRRKLYGIKIFVGITLSLAALAIFCLATVLPALCIYGADGFGAQLQLLLPTTVFHLSVGQAVLILIGLSVLVTLLQCAVSITLAESTKSSAAVMAVMIGFVLITSLISIPDEFYLLAKIWDYNPNNLLALWCAFSDRLIHIAGHYFAVYQAAPVIYLVLFAGLLGIGKRLYERYQVTGR